MQHIILICFIFTIILWPPFAQAKEFERGEATFSVQSSLLRTDSDFFDNNQSENDFIIDLSQNTIDYGVLHANIIASNIETTWKIGSFNAGVKDFWLSNKTNMDFEAGDTSLNFRTIPSFFTNFIVPSVPIRALDLRFGNDKWFTDFFSGWFTQRDGYLGNAYTRQDEYFFGGNFGFELPRESFLGGGFVRTQNERTDAGRLLVKNNNVFLADAKVGLFKDFFILGEFLYSFYDSVALGKKSGLLLVAGPTYEVKDKFHLQANYRNLGQNFYYLTRSYQTVNNQEGTYVFADYRIPDLLYLYGSGDFYWMKPTPGIATNLIYNVSGNLGATYYVSRDWYVNLSSNVFTQFTSGQNTLDEGTRYEIFTSVSGNSLQGKLTTYARGRYRENRINNPSNVERDPDGIIGARWYLNRRLNMQFESEVEARWDDLRTIDLIISRFKYYLDWRPLSRIYLTPGVEYIKTFDIIGPADRNQIALSLDYGHEFRHGLSAFASVRWTKGWGFFRDSYVDLFINVQKIFRWGKPHLRLGIPQKDLPIISGRIKGSIFIDENGDRKRQLWEKGISNIPIILDEGFVTETNVNGEYFFNNVLTGDRIVAIDMASLPLEYQPVEMKHKIKVHVRDTTEVDFPVRYYQK